MRTLRSLLVFLLLFGTQLPGAHAYYPFPNGEKGQPPHNKRAIERGQLWLNESTTTDTVNADVPDSPITTVPLPKATPAVEPSLEVPVLPHAKKVTRAELIKIAINSRFGIMDMRHCFLELSPSRYWLLFADVPVGVDYSVQLCTAMRLGSIDGYSNGMFQPDKEVNLAEASKMLAQAFSLPVDLRNSESLHWYIPYVNALQEAGVNMYGYGKMSTTVSYESIMQMVDTLKAHRQ